MPFVLRLMAAVAALSFSLAAAALQPYLAGDPVEGGDLDTAMSKVAARLQAAGFTVVGQHKPAGLPAGSVVVTDPDLMAAIAQVGGSVIVAAPIRVGVLKDGSVSAVNPEYWLRAFTADNYGRFAKAADSVAARLKVALNATRPFGGDVRAEDLPRYRYMIGMERFGDRSLVAEHPSFDAAKAAVEANLLKGVDATAKVYWIEIPEARLAVIGFAQNDPERGERWWVQKIDGVDHIAALPWEVFIVDGKVYSLYARYRTALSWPTLGMMQFMRISSHPDATQKMAADIAGAKP